MRYAHQEMSRAKYAKSFLGHLAFLAELAREWKKGMFTTSKGHEGFRRINSHFVRFAPSW